MDDMREILNVLEALPVGSSQGKAAEALEEAGYSQYRVRTAASAFVDLVREAFVIFEDLFRVLMEDLEDMTATLKEDVEKDESIAG